MTVSLLVVDNFYADPFDVRALALRSEFEVRGNFPGRRTQAFLHDGIRAGIERSLNDRITYWPAGSYNGAFQYTIAEDRTWVHADHTTTWSGVLFLTPGAPNNSGTGFYRHIATGLDWYPADPNQQIQCNKSASEWEHWHRTERIANVFNRLLLFRGRRFHASLAHFGTDAQNGRLFQTFFFDTQN